MLGFMDASPILLNINLDLLLVGVAVASIVLLGYIIFFNNTQSVTNRTFLYFSILTAVWGISNYLEYRFTTIPATLWAMRVHLLLSVWHAFIFFQLAYVFPKDLFAFPRWYRYGLLPVVVTTMIVVLTPLVFSGIGTLAPPGYVTNPDRGPGLVLFSVVALGLLLAGVVTIVGKAARSSSLQERKQEYAIAIGMALTAALILMFNVVLPIFFNELGFIPYAALFLLPFVSLISYSIYQYHLFNIKVFSTAVLVFLLSVFSFGEIIFADTFSLLLFRSSVFVLVLIFGISLVRGVLREVEQRERIQKLAQELEMYNEQLSEFMSLATHEIRNPATFIRGYTASALEGDLGELSPALKDGMQKLHVRANDIIHLGNQYLNKSKIELHQLKYEFVSCDMKKLTEDLVREFAPAAEQQGVALSFAAEPDKEYTIQADAGKIKEVVSNLIDNSVKYTPQGSVSVSLARTDASVIVTVADTGLGIPADVIPKLFQKFSRADAEKANILGTGLGLYLSKIFVEAHHGTIHVASEGKNKGSTFTVELPLTKAPLAH